MKSKPFSPEEIEALKAAYPNTSSIDLAKQYGRSVRAIYSFATRYKLNKSEEFRNSPSSGRLQKGTILGASTQFKKGSIPPNKGKKMEDFMKPETAAKFKANYFKKGNTPHNAYPDWHESLVTEKKTGRQYIRIKVPGIRKLVFKHYFIYNEAHGKIPDGHVISFKDGNSLNCVLENLEVISMQSNMGRNSINRFPEELKSVIRLLSKLNKKINTHEEQDGRLT